MKQFKLSILVFLIFNINSVFAQSNFNDDATFIKRCYTGGKVGLSIGPQSYIEVSPIFGYNINHLWSLGLGITWINYSTKYIDNTGKAFRESVNVTGGSIFTRVLLGDPTTGTGLPNLFIHGELETIGYKNPYYVFDPVNQLRRYQFFAPMIGLGYRSQVGRNSFYSFSFLYVFDSNNPNNPYSQNSLPIVPKAGFVIGF